MNLVRRFVTDERGATAIEYGLIAAGISGHHRRREHARHKLEHDIQQHLVTAQITSPRCRRALSLYSGAAASGCPSLLKKKVPTKAVGTFKVFPSRGRIQNSTRIAK